MKSSKIVYMVGLTLAAAVYASTLVATGLNERNQRSNGNRAAFEAGRAAELSGIYVMNALRKTRAADDSGNHYWVERKLTDASVYLQAAEGSTRKALQQKASTGQPVESLTERLAMISDAKTSVDDTLSDILRSQAPNTEKRLQNLRDAAAKIGDAKTALYAQANGYSVGRIILLSFGSIFLATCIATASLYASLRQDDAALNVDRQKA